MGHFKSFKPGRPLRHALYDHIFAMKESIRRDSNAFNWVLKAISYEKLTDNREHGNILAYDEVYATTIGAIIRRCPLIDINTE